VQRTQRVVAEIKIQEIRQVTEHVGVPEFGDLVLLQVELYQLREIAGKIKDALNLSVRTTSGKRAIKGQTVVPVHKDIVKRGRKVSRGAILECVSQV